MDKKLNVTNQNVKLALSKAKELLRNTNSIKNKNIDIINFKDDIQTWKDQDTGLIWEIKSSNNIDEIYTYDEAISYVKNLNMINFGGINSWEIPSIKDLETLSTQELNNNLYIKKILSENSDWAYWSSTVLDEIKNYVYYYNCREKRLEFQNFQCYLRCVCKVNCDE
ncbi:DUF1566 domain-containing protein [Aliarcobacter sp. ERUVET-7]|uniref:Lcl C-terminal domain-containing protein n=1 Tax=Aliarcobacter TaxID=2321111 RepID=UPI0021B6D3A3|nr:DUF1566 domain-containing protein [Aliarcobacter cryaerophilus]MCT7545777.1 DUF1566 domain-containing protein [Aliarcobacter cryaerophilus]